MPDALSRREPLLSTEVAASRAAQGKDQSRIEEEKEDDVALGNSLDAGPVKPDLWYLVYYVFAELPPDRKPADSVLDSVKDIPVGTPLEEIKRAADVFGLDFNFMKAVAKIESDFDPKQSTGSYIGLFLLSKYEFAKYGSGDITSPRDNAVAAAYKFVTEARLFEWETHKKPTFSDLYLIHQQGWQGAAEHIAQPERIAWKSMCDTDEGREKGEKWCRRAVWGNTLPAVKKIWKSVDRLTSREFVSMWRQRVDHFYARYSEASAGGIAHLASGFGVAQGGALISPTPKSHAGRLSTVARGNFRAPRLHARQLRGPVALAGRRLPIRSPAAPPSNGGRTAHARTTAGQAVATAAGRATTRSGRAQRQAAAVPR
ncbi:MAG: hypothetical protein ACLPMG_05570 [Terriglobales bacterium]